VKRLHRALAGEAVWPPPVWLMRQAGRYLPEYRELRARAGDFIALCTTPTLAAEVTLQPVRRFGMDAAILFSDILMLPWALGQELRFAQGEGPVLAPIETEADVDRLDPARMIGAIAPILETVARVAEGVGEATLIGFAGSPFTVACYMVDGHGTKEYPKTRMLAYADPVLFARLMDLLVAATTDYLLAQASAGAEALMLFDSWAGVLPPALFRAHVIEPTRRIVAGVRAVRPDIPMIGFPRLAGSMLAEYAAGVGAHGIGLDTQAEPVLAARALRAAGLDHVALQGNLDPLVLVRGGRDLDRAVDDVLSAARGRPWVFNLGHGIVPETPPEHVARLVERVRVAHPAAA
jgi:uroporphyrinogen decarboxylase